MGPSGRTEVSSRTRGGSGVDETARARAVDAHYGRADLATAVLDGLRAAGKDLNALTPDDLAPVDQLHVRGKEATLDLARLAGLRKGDRLLDVGGGLGGPARMLAATYGCRVTVLDLTEVFCRVGEMLTERTGLGDRVSFRHASALDMPFPDASFDVAWTQHSTMNVADKARLYAELRRVLRPGGRLAMHEFLAGPVQPIHFPIPSARDASLNFLKSPEATLALLDAAGFAPLAWADVSDATLDALRRAVAARAAAPAPPPLGPHLVYGPGIADASRNVLRNLEERRVLVFVGVQERR